jgi:hypothetical protein
LIAASGSAGREPRQTRRAGVSILFPNAEGDLAEFIYLCVKDFVIEGLRRTRLEEDLRACFLDDLVVLRRDGGN